MNWVHFAIGILLTFLQGTIKNPVSLEKEKAILLELYSVLTEALVVAGVKLPLLPPTP
jgi:hypothetical protein